VTVWLWVVHRPGNTCQSLRLLYAAKKRCSSIGTHHSSTVLVEFKLVAVGCEAPALLELGEPPR
jgi:hypothetical protein